MATLSLPSALPEQNGAIKSHSENGSDPDTVLPNLMQKLKMTTKQIKAWSQTSHKLRLAMSKYTEPDPVDPNRLQKCLDKLKMAIEVSSVPAMHERLDAIARQVGLKTNWSIDNVYLSSDCFYVEVLLAPNGGVKDVKLVHGMNGNIQSCEEMCEVLKKNDFKEFTEHLKGLCQMYQLGGDSKMKTTAFNCLQALEMDLKTLFVVKFGATHTLSGSPLLHITKGFVGYLTPRVGGHLMRLTYFVSPYDLLDVEKKQTKELSLTEPLPKDLGLSVTVGIESASQRKIQTAPTIMVTDNKIPNVIPLGNQNSILIPATFVLKLSEPMPMSVILLKQLQNISGVSTQYADPTAATPLNTLICRFTLDPVTFLQNQTKDGRHSRTKNYTVELPDQHHSYIINDGTNPNDLRDMQGALLSKITFTVPNSVVKIIALLRQQAVYNTLIASCVRNKDSDEEPSESVLFEVTPYTNQKLTVTFEHPAREGVACVELDLTDNSAVKAKLHGGPNEEPFCSDDYATKVLQKCLSIPITMRAILKKAEQWLETHESKKSVSLPPAPSSGPSGGSVFDPMSGIHRHSGLGGGGHGSSFFPSHRPHQSSFSHQPQSHSILSDLTTTMSAILPHGEGFDMHGDKPTKVAQNPMLASLLQHAALAVSTSSLSIPPLSPSLMSSPPLASGPKPHKNPMLMNLLQEQNTLTPVAAIAQPVGSMGRMIRRGKRGRSVSVDKSPKRQQSEEDHDFDDVHGHRPGLHHRFSDTHKMSSHAMDPPKTVHTGELSALLSEIEAPIIPVTKPKRGRPCRLDSSSSQSSISARQSPKTPSTPTVPTTPTFAPPKAMSHSTLSTPEHPSMDDAPAGIKSDQLHSRTSLDSDIFSQNSKIFSEDLLPDPPRSNISPEMNRQASFRSQYSSIDINEDAAGFDNDDDFGGLPSVSSAIARMGIPTGSEFDDQHRTTTDLPHPVSLSTMTSGPLSTAIQAGLETRTDMKMGAGALDLSVANLAKSMSIPAIPTGQRPGRPGPNMQGVTNLSQSLPATRPRVPVSKGKPKNFIESSLAFQSEKPKASKKRGRKGVKDSGGFSDSDAPKTKKLRRPGRLKKERRLPEYSSESSPEPCQDVDQYSSITMAVNEEEPLKMTFKTIRHKPDKEQKAKAKDPGPAPKIKIRAMTSGDSATPSPNPVVKDIKEEKPLVKQEPKVEQHEKTEPVLKSVKIEPPIVKSDIPKDTKVVKEEGLPKPHKEVSTGHRSEEQATKGTTQEVSKGSQDITVIKSEHSAVKSSPITKVTSMTHMSKVKSEQMKKSRPVEGSQRPSPVPKSPIADFFPKKNLANLPRIPKISKQTSESKQSPNPKTPSTPKPAGSPSPTPKSLLGSPKKSSWGKGDPSKVGATKKLVTAQRFSSVSPTGRKPDGMRAGKPFSGGNKSPLTVGQGIRKAGPNILSKSMSTPTQSPSSSKASTGPVQASSRNVSSPTTGVSKTMSQQVKPSGTVSPVPKTSAGMSSKPLTTPISLTTSSRLPSSQAISVSPSVKTTSVAPLTSATTPSNIISSSSSTKTISSSPTATSVVSSSAVVVQSVSSVPATSSTPSTNSTAATVSTSTTSSTVTASVTPITTAGALPKSVTPPPLNLIPSSKPPATTSTTTSNRPPPLVIPTNVKVPTPSVTSPPTPSSIGTPTSAGPNSAKQTTPKSGMRGNRKFSLMGIIDKIKEKNEKGEKTDKGEKVEKVERKGLFSALGSETSGIVSGNSDEKVTDSSAKEAKETVASEEGAVEKSQLPKESKDATDSKADDTPTMESKAMTFPLSKSDSTKTPLSKVSSASSQLPVRQPSPSMSTKPSGLTPSPSSQGSSSVKGKSSPKHPSQSRPPKGSTPPLTGSQKRAGSPTGKSISIKQSKPSPLSTSSSSTAASMGSPVKARPGSSPMQRTRPIILSHSLSTYQSPEKGQQKITKVQLAMQPELVSPSAVPGQGTSPSSVSKGPTNASQVRVPSPSIKSHSVTTSKPTQESTKKSTTSMSKPADTAKSEIKLASAPKPLKPDQNASMKAKSNNGKEPSPNPQQNNQRSDPKGSSDNSRSKLPPTDSKKLDTKQVDPRARKDSQGSSKDKDGENTSKSPKPAVVRTVSKEAKSLSSSGSQDGKLSGKTEQKPTTEAVQKPKVTPPLVKMVSHGDKEKVKGDELRKSESKNIVPEIKGTDKQEVPEEVSKTSASTKPAGIDFKVPSPAMVPSPKNPVMSPRPITKPASSPKPVVAYSPKAPSPHASASGVPSPGSALSPKTPSKRSATPVGNQPPPTKKVCTISTPYSPMESDDDLGMVIDMPQSPRSISQQKPQRSPRPDSRNSNTQTEAGSTSPRSAVAHSPLGQLAQSPLGIGKSPASVKSIGSDSMSRSPCKIDDDLMDEALTSCIQTEDV